VTPLVSGSSDVAEANTDTSDAFQHRNSIVVINRDMYFSIRTQRRIPYQSASVSELEAAA
jgi:hypothetical protein